jgi:hypothetical protein
MGFSPRLIFVRFDVAEKFALRPFAQVRSDTALEEQNARKALVTGQSKEGSMGVEVIICSWNENGLSLASLDRHPAFLVSLPLLLADRVDNGGRA